MLGLQGFKAVIKNAAGTFAHLITSLATANRNVSLPDKDGTLALVTDITDRIGAANGLAPLDANSLISPAYLPSYVDDVLEYDTKAQLNATVGTKGKIFLVDADESDGGVTNQYRWSGSAFIKIISSPGSTDAIAEGATNKYWSLARTVGAVLTGLSLASTAAVSAADTILVAIGKLQAQIKAIPYDVMTFVGGKPAAGGKVLFIKSGRAFTIPANFAGAQIESLTAATAASVWTLTKNGTAVGTFSWAIGGVVPTLATTGGTAISVAVADKLILTAGGTQDSTLADAAVHLLATLT